MQLFSVYLNCAVQLLDLLIELHLDTPDLTTEPIQELEELSLNTAHFLYMIPPVLNAGPLGEGPNESWSWNSSS